jgi:hypothetical protein
VGDLWNSTLHTGHTSGADLFGGIHPRFGAIRVVYRTLAADAVKIPRYVARFGESRARQPRDAVADLEPGILDGDGEPVPGAGAAEGQQMPAGLQHAETLFRPIQTGRQRIPMLPHKPKPVRWIRHDGVDAVGGELGHRIQTVPVDNSHIRQPPKIRAGMKSFRHP